MTLQSMAMANNASQGNAQGGDEPLYVNAKQYHRILKRREARGRQEALSKSRKDKAKQVSLDKRSVLIG